MRSNELPRQKNVQQQNLQVENRIRSEAVHWRENKIPAALQEVGERKGVDWSAVIVVDLDIDFPGMPQLFGLLVTAEERFIRFAIHTDDAHQTVESVDEWIDVTNQQNLRAANETYHLPQLKNR
ncbi:hypothetical protein [Roseateles sp. BYS96W]|uniref:Uncharacterized protein n=1 Tax=Pelomonas nitida TaxID=3299027 RepID=A0ABW7G8Q7_9BURK